MVEAIEQCSCHLGSVMKVILPFPEGEIRADGDHGCCHRICGVAISSMGDLWTGTALCPWLGRGRADHRPPVDAGARYADRGCLASVTFTLIPCVDLTAPDIAPATEAPIGIHTRIED